MKPEPSELRTLKEGEIPKEGDIPSKAFRSGIRLFTLGLFCLVAAGFYYSILVGLIVLGLCLCFVGIIGQISAAVANAAKEKK